MPGRSTKTQQALDRINQIATEERRKDPFGDVGKIIQGNATARDIREPDQLCIDDAVLPPNTIPTSDTPALNVAISPESFDQGANQATQPFLQTINTFSATQPYVTVAQFNASRLRLMIQNVGTNALFVVFGKASQFGADVSTHYHLQIAAGATYIDDLWQGRVDVAAATSTQIIVTEMTRAQNVSQ